MKKILYVTPLVVGFQDLLEGGLDSRGLPSFILPLKKMMESQNYEVHIVLISNFREVYNIKVDWFNSDNIVGNINNDLTTNNLFLKLTRKIKSSYQLIKLLLDLSNKNEYDIIYCHGKAAVWGNIIAIIKGIPCAYRLYGVVSYYHDLVKYGKLFGAFLNPIYSIIFKLPKKFLMITDDGTFGDKAYQIMKPRMYNYEFFFLVNGVDHQNIDDLTTKMIPTINPYIFHAARIDQLKRQDRNILVLEKLVHRGYEVDLLFAGHYDEEGDYYKYLKSIIQEKGLSDHVHFLGPVNRDEMKAISYNAVCTLLMGDVANNGNVFYEVFSTGSIVVGIDDEGLRRYITNSVNGFLIKDEEEAASIIEKLMTIDNDDLNSIKNRAITTAKQKLLSWDERVNIEIQELFD